MNDLKSELSQIVESVIIRAPDQYELRGRHVQLVPAVSNTPEPCPALVSHLAKDIYFRLYCKPAPTQRALTAFSSVHDHVNCLSASNRGTGCWEQGWKVAGVSRGDRIPVSRDHVTFWATRDKVVFENGKPEAGQACRVRIGKEMRQLIPGYYCAIGNAAPHRVEPQLRFYWNLSSEAAVSYIAGVTGLFNDAQIPFRTKVLADPAAYVRADSAVLYVEKRFAKPAMGCAKTLYRELAPAISSDVPLFTRQLAPGLAIAEDPINRKSFGQSRAEAVSRALWECFLNATTSVEDQVAHILAVFAVSGFHTEVGHLNEGSTDSYEWPGDLPDESGSGAASQTSIRMRSQ